MLSTYHVFSLLFCFFSFPVPLLCRLNFLLLVWKLYILLVVPSHLFGPIPYLITVLGLKSLSTILPFSVLFTCAGPVTSSGLDSVGDSSPFPLQPCSELDQAPSGLSWKGPRCSAGAGGSMHVWGLLGSQEGAGGSIRNVSVGTVLIAQLYLTLFNPVDCSPSCSSVHGILQARIPCGCPFPSPEDLPNPRIEPRSPALQVNSLPSGPPRKIHLGRPLQRWITDCLHVSK